jgi:hypothetical protein
VQLLAVQASAPGSVFMTQQAYEVGKGFFVKR